MSAFFVFSLYSSSTSAGSAVLFLAAVELIWFLLKPVVRATLTWDERAVDGDSEAGSLDASESQLPKVVVVGV